MALQDLWIEVFKAGTHTDASGNTREWTIKDIDTIVALYNNQPEDSKHEAPIVIGHPEDNSPAYGWVEKLKRDGDVLLAKLKDLAPEFVAWVKKGLYKKRSISLYSDLLLKHVGFLGGVPPAVKGLADPKFANEKASILIEFGELEKIADIHQQERSIKYGITIKDKGHQIRPKYYEGMDEDDFADPVNWKLPLTEKYLRATLANWARNTVKERYSAEEQELISQRINNAINRIKNQNYNQRSINMSEDKFNLLLSDLITWLSDTFGEEVANQTNGFLDTNRAKYLQTAESESEGKGNNDNSQLEPEPEAQNHKEDPRVKELELQVAQLQKANREKDFRQYVEKLVKEEGKLLPKQIDYAIALLELGHNAGRHQFVEQGKVKEAEAVLTVKKFLESFDKKVDISPIPEGPKTDHSYSEFAGLNVDEERLALDKKVQSFISEQLKQGKIVNYLDALNIVTKEKE